MDLRCSNSIYIFFVIVFFFHVVHVIFCVETDSVVYLFNTVITSYRYVQVCQRFCSVYKDLLRSKTIDLSKQYRFACYINI